MDTTLSKRSAALQKYGVEKLSASPGKTYWYNKMAQVRPDCTFDRFELYCAEQKPIVGRLQSLAEQLVGKSDQILNQEFPFAHGRIMFLTSDPGYGKTHLVEAVINHVADKRPELLSKMVLSRGNFLHDHMTAACEYGGASVVIIDDIFSEHQSIESLHPATDLKSFMHFITMLYERRLFALITSNFRLMAEDGGILGRVALCDKVGRVLSRCKQVLASSGETILPGQDFRQELAKRQAGENFTL